MKEFSFHSFVNSQGSTPTTLLKLLVPNSSNDFFYINLFILFILFLAELGLHCCTQAFSSCIERGLLFAAVHRLLIAVASLVGEHRL